MRAPRISAESSSCSWLGSAIIMACKTPPHKQPAGQDPNQTIRELLEGAGWDGSQNDYPGYLNMARPYPGHGKTL